MKTRRKAMHLRASALAVHGALGLAAGAQAQTGDAELYALTHPGSRIELGVGGASRYAAKANEYTGLDKKDPYLLADIELRGGGAYDSSDATRWQLVGTDLGTRSRALGADYAVQGKFRVQLHYGELRRNQSDSYQTPYLGIGTRVMTLPPTWVQPVIPALNATAPSARGLSPGVTSSSAIVGGVLTAPTADQLAAAGAMQAADLSAFRHVDLYTQRTDYGVSWQQVIDERWGLELSLANENKKGLKPLGAHTHANGGDTSSILPIPIDQDDRKGALVLSYTGSTLQFQAGYEVSSFVNKVPSVTWDFWSAPTGTTDPLLKSATMSTAPSNLFQKFWLSGSVQVSPATRVAAAASRSTSTQNEAFLADPTAPIVAGDSARARVVGESASLKLSHRSSAALTLGAALKHDLRENRTPVGTYVFYDNLEEPSGVSPFRYLFPTLPDLGANANIAANTPYSRRVDRLLLDADYHLGRGHRLKAELDTSRTDRYCLGTWVNCVNASDSTEHALKLDWWGPLGADVSGRLGLQSARRRVDYNENSFLARVPMANQEPTGAPPGTSAYNALLALGFNGYGPALGLLPAAPPGSTQDFYFPLNNALSNSLYGFRNRISELLGMRRFDQADRDRNALRSSLSWSPSDKVELQGGLDYRDDHYAHSVYGMQRASTGALNLDASYTPSDRASLHVFASYEEQRSRFAGNTYVANSTAVAVNGATQIVGGCFATIPLRNASNKIDPCLDWVTTQRDRTTTLGADVALHRLMGGKLELGGSAVYSEGRTALDVAGGNYVNNPLAGAAGDPTAAIAAYYVPAGALPVVTVRSASLALSGTWQLSPKHALRLAYGYQHLRSSDWAYEGLQDGSVTQVLPTREQAPSYDVHRVGLSYIASF